MATRIQTVWWWRLVAALLALLAMAFVVITRWSVLLASHPAYWVATGVVVVVALGAVLTARRPVGGWRRRWVRVTTRALGLLLAVVVVGSLVYLRPFATTAPASAMASGGQVTVAESATRIELRPAGTPLPTGVIFWPGARVDARAYVPLLRRLAADGYLVVVVKEPLGISLLDQDAATAVIADHPETTRWVVGGHSLGGVTASTYAGAHAKVAGLLLWASYPLGTLVDRTGLRVTSVSGTKDGLTTPDDVAASRAKLPPGTTFVAVEGAVHAYFADYGEQPGDGTPSVGRSAAQTQIISATAQLLATVDAA